MENPEDGPNLFRLVRLKAIEKVSHKKKVEIVKAQNDANDVGFTADDVDLGWTMEGHQQSIAQLCSWQAVKLQCRFGELCTEQCCQCPWNW